MNETIYSGIAIGMEITEEHHEEFNSVRWWYEDIEIDPFKVKMVVYNDKEQE